MEETRNVHDSWKQNHSFSSSISHSQISKASVCHADNIVDSAQLNGHTERIDND